MRIKTGLEEFDYVTGGLYNGELTVGAGRPGDGKTAIAMQIAMNVALSGKHVCFFSMEMTGLQTMNRLFAGFGGVDANRLRITGANPEDLLKMEKWRVSSRTFRYILTILRQTRWKISVPR